MTDETKKNGEAMPDAADDGLVILQDENGEDVPFEHLLTLDVNGKTYIVLEATRDMEDCLQGESILLRIDQDENGDDLYAAAAGPDMLVAAGANGAAFYSTDGAAWSPVTGIERIEPIGGTPLYDFTSVVHAGGGVFWATLTRPTKWIDGGVSSLYRIQNGHAELVQGGFTNPINSLAAASGQDAVFAAGEGGVIMTTNASYKETGISPPFLLLLLN